MKKFFIALFLILLVVVIAENRKKAPPTENLSPTGNSGKENPVAPAAFKNIDADAIKSSTKQCRETTGTIPQGMVGLSIVPPYSTQYFDLLTDLGIKWVRAEFYWSEIERSDGTYDWSAGDSLVEEMHKRNISIAGIISYIPRSLSSDEEIRAHFNAFVPALVERYKRGGTLARAKGWGSYGVRSWEIFNEPNLPGYGWLSKEKNPRMFVGQYTALLAAANAHIREKDPSAAIVLGGLSPEGMPYKEFLENLYSYGTQKCFDVLAFHPYGRMGRFAQVVAELRGIAASNDDTGKIIWFNEYGTTDEKIRVDTIRKAFEERSAADGLFWFSLRDLKSRGWAFGLTQFDFTKKPAFDVFRDLLKKSDNR